MYSITHVLYTDIVLNTLNPDRAVEIITPGICGCQWISFTSVWPWCRNRSWGGRSFTPSTRAPTSHDSTDRSHWLTTSSAAEAANTLESAGLHSTEVTGALCCLKFATGRPLCRWNQRYHVWEHNILIFLMKCFCPTDSVSAAETTFTSLYVFYLIFNPVKHFVIAVKSAI